jgi:hypothetical protein
MIMKNIELILEIKGKNKTFVCTKIKGIMLRKTARVAKVFEDMGKGLTEEKLDELVDYMVELFENKFTREEYYDGIDIDKVVSEIQRVAADIIEMASGKIKN